MFSPDLPIPDLLAASRRPEVVAAMEAFYAEADRLIAARGPTCWNRGLCCRFGEYGHRLYVTALEVAYYLARTPPPSEPAAHLSRRSQMAEPEVTGPLSEPGVQTTGRPSEPRAHSSRQSRQAEPQASGSPSEPEAHLSRRSQMAKPEARVAASPSASEGGFTTDVCPHALTGICRARDRRPLGCRIFYCDPAAQDWQGPLTEQLLSRLRDLHERYDVPYFYADWMAVLRALSEAGAARFSTPG